MKKVLYIGLFIIGLVFTACQKQDIAPVTNESQEVPEWDFNTKTRTNEDGENGKPTTVDPGGDGIVDPEKEEEENEESQKES